MLYSQARTVGWCVASSRQAGQVCTNAAPVTNTDLFAAVATPSPQVTVRSATPVPDGDSGYASDEARTISRGRYPECVVAPSVSYDEMKRIRSALLSLRGTALAPEQPGPGAISRQQDTTRKEQDRHVRSRK